MRLAIAPNDQTATLAVGDEIDEEAADDAPEADGPSDDADAPENEDPDVSEAPDETAETSDETRWVLAVEDAPTGDGRRFDTGSLSFADFPFPLMATDKTSEGHDGAQLVGHFVRGEIEPGGEAIAWSKMIDSDDEDVKNLQRLIDDGSLGGISVDLDQVEGNIVVKFDDHDEEENPDEMVILFGGDREVQTITKGRIRAATALPIPAFVEAKRSDEPLTAALLSGSLDHFQPQPIVAAASSHPIKPTSVPPADWFDDPKLSGPVPLTVGDDGRIFGHVALWQSCHRSFETCTPPPRAPGGDYSHFHTGTLVASDGSRVEVGQITVDSGHADLTNGAYRAKEHYDHTGWAGADVKVGEDAHGIWMAGAVRGDLDADRLRALMAADVSGDWRAIDGKLRLIGLASVPVPGFVKTQVASGALMALVASVPVCDDENDAEMRAIADRIALSIGRHSDQIAAERDRIAFGLGRHPAQRRQALAVRVDQAR